MKFEKSSWSKYLTITFSISLAVYSLNKVYSEKIEKLVPNI